MCTTLSPDDELLAKAQALTGLSEKAAVVREALKALVEREFARRFAGFGGSDAYFCVAPHRQEYA